MLHRAQSVCLPPNASGLLAFRVEIAENLKAPWRLMTMPDAFTQLDIGLDSYQTAVCQSSTSPIWNEEVLINVLCVIVPV